MGSTRSPRKTGSTKNGVHEKRARKFQVGTIEDEELASSSTHTPQEIADISAAAKEASRLRIVEGKDGLTNVVGRKNNVQMLESASNKSLKWITSMTNFSTAKLSKAEQEEQGMVLL